jgi:hypothetical protein
MTADTATATAILRIKVQNNCHYGRDAEVFRRQMKTPKLGPVKPD